MLSLRINWLNFKALMIIFDNSIAIVMEKNRKYFKIYYFINNI